MNKIRVFIVDDHPIFRQGLRQTIESDPRMAVVGEAGEAGEALEKIKGLKPEVAVVDLNLPGIDGLELTRSLQKLQPQPGTIILTMHKDDQMVQGALDRGARGYVLKDNALDEVLGAILAVARGDFYVTPALSACLIRRNRAAESLEKEKPGLAALTPMERRVLKLIAESKTSRQIGGELFISPRTVDTHRNNIRTKLGLCGSHKLLQFALSHRPNL